MELWERTLTGDILIASGIIAYLGVFTGAYRKEACDGWLQKLSDLKIPASKEFSLSSLGMQDQKKDKKGMVRLGELQCEER